MESIKGMEVRLYESTDYEVISMWYKERNLRAPAIDLIPNYGFIVPGVAAAFLYQTDSNLAIVDGCISNKRAPKDMRTAALNVILTETLKTAKDLNYRVVVISSTVPSIIEKCTKQGFKEAGNYTFLSREL